MKLARNTFWYLLAAFFQQAPLYLLLPWWSHHLSKADFGVTGTLQVYGWVFGHLLTIGLPQALYRFHFDRLADEAGRRRQVRTFVWIQAAWAGAAGAGLWFCGSALWPAVSGGNIPWMPLGGLAVLVAVGESILQIPLTLCLAAERARLYAGIQLARGLLLTLLLWWFVVRQGQGASGWMHALAGCALVSGGTLAAVLAVRFRGPGLETALLRPALRYGLPLVPNQLAMWVLHGIGRLVVEKQRGIEEAGRFGFASQLALAAYVLILGLAQAWTPRYYHAVRSGQETAWMHRSLGWYWGIGSVLASLGILLVRPLLLLFPAHLRDAAPLVGPLLLGMLAFGGYSLHAAQLNYHHRTHVTPWITGLTALVAFAAQAALVPRHGSAAAAWVTAGSLILLWAGFAAASRRATGLRSRAVLATACLAAPAAVALCLCGIAA